MSRTEILAALSLSLLVLIGTAALAAPFIRVANAIWGDGVLFDTVVTDTSFNSPPSHTVDVLYNFSMSGLMGQRSVSEAVPGDPDYNGGRWWVQMVVFTEQGLEAHDPDGDGFVNFELKSAEEVLAHEALGHLEILPTATYFVCPLNRAN